MKHYSRLIGLGRLKMKKCKHIHSESFGFVVAGIFVCSNSRIWQQKPVDGSHSMKCTGLEPTEWITIGEHCQDRNGLWFYP